MANISDYANGYRRPAGNAAGGRAVDDVPHFEAPSPAEQAAIYRDHMAAREHIAELRKRGILVGRVLSNGGRMAGEYLPDGRLPSDPDHAAKVQAQARAIKAGKPIPSGVAKPLVELAADGKTWVVE